MKKKKLKRMTIFLRLINYIFNELKLTALEKIVKNLSKIPFKGWICNLIDSSNHKKNVKKIMNGAE